MRALTPPASHQCEKPLLFRWQIFEEDCCIQDKVTSGTESAQTYEKTEDDPGRRSTSYDSENGADQEGYVESESSPDDVCRHTPEQSPNKHSDVDSDSETILEAGLKLVSCLWCDDTLDEKNEGIGSISGSSKDVSDDIFYSSSRGKFLPKAIETK